MILDLKGVGRIDHEWSAYTDDIRTPETFVRLHAGEEISCCRNLGSILVVSGNVSVQCSGGTTNERHVRTPYDHVIHALDNAVVKILGTHRLADRLLVETSKFPLEMPRLIRVSAEAFYVSGELFSIDEMALQTLRDSVSGTPRQRIRICCHRDIHSRLHEMFVCYTKESQVIPHKHLAKDESFHVLEGELDFIKYNQDGDVLDIISMGDYASGKPFYVRVPRDTYHKVVVHSDICVLHEGTAGPFDREHTRWAAWQ